MSSVFHETTSLSGGKLSVWQAAAWLGSLCSVAAGPIFAGMLLAGFAVPGLALAADAANGGDVYDEECAECHSLKPGKNKKGPGLFAVSGRKAGEVADYHYSDAMKASGIIWSPDQLDAYIAAPKMAVPGGKMKYKGLKDAGARADVIEFLSTQK